MANYYNTNVTANPVLVSQSSETHIVRATWLNGQYFALSQTVTTTVQKYEGIGLADAQALCVSTESSTLGGVTRNYLGGAELRSSGGAWMYADACWGTQTSATMNAMSPNMYEVTVTTQTMTVSKTDQSLTLTLT